MSSKAYETWCLLETTQKIFCIFCNKLQNGLVKIYRAFHYDFSYFSPFSAMTISWGYTLPQAGMSFLTKLFKSLYLIASSPGVPFYFWAFQIFCGLAPGNKIWVFFSFSGFPVAFSSFSYIWFSSLSSTLCQSLVFCHVFTGYVSPDVCPSSDAVNILLSKEV